MIVHMIAPEGTRKQLFFLMTIPRIARTRCAGLREKAGHIASKGRLYINVAQNPGCRNRIKSRQAKR
ncbi:protein of unknown function (plasmid) [Cupriavidus taiwanensis]|uniref:Uncharacterized protein n=1 Tax=Cupriavidus taiwanensis TaxID=164546 RepID=A0A375HEX5_9BURK|nr:protein of unknown function [Cupriavidus taiwanensis]SPD48820.1 protein of unknown function [Cupriavidus taiwanensis]